MKVRNGADRKPALQRLLPFAAKSRDGSISLQRSSAAPVQFRDLLITKTRKDLVNNTRNQLLE